MMLTSYSKEMLNLKITLKILPNVQFSSAVLGTIVLIGKLIRVKLKSPESIFFPNSLIIYFAVDLILATYYFSPHILPPFTWPN